MGLQFARQPPVGNLVNHIPVHDQERVALEEPAQGAEHARGSQDLGFEGKPEVEPRGGGLGGGLDGLGQVVEVDDTRVPRRRLEVRQASSGGWDGSDRAARVWRRSP